MEGRTDGWVDGSVSTLQSPILLILNVKFSRRGPLNQLSELFRSKNNPPSSVIIPYTFIKL